MKTIHTILKSMFLVLLGAGPAAAQGGGRPVHLVVPYTAGGGADFVARGVAAPMSKALGRPIVIENVSGAGGNIGVARVVRAAPDGETLLFHIIAMATNPSLYRKLDYNPLADFEYVGVVAHSVMVMVARPDLPAADLRQFIDYARKNGDKVTIGDGGVGGPGNLCGLLFMSMIGTQFTTVTYKGGAPALQGVMGRQIDLFCDGTATASKLIAAGKVKALGISSRTRLRSMPDVPTLDEAGLPGFELRPWSGIYAPRNTPKATVDRLSAALRAAIADKELVAYFDKMGLLPSTQEMATSAGLQAHLRTEIERWGGLLKKAGVQPVD